jgi:FkbM family methyltransferase
VVAVNSHLRTELDELLHESVDSARQREIATFDRAVSMFGDRIVLFGAGNLGRKALTILRRDGVEPLAFVDNNASLWGKSVDGVRVYPPAEGAEVFGKSASFVLAIWRGEGTDTMAQRRQPLVDAGCINVVDFGALFWKHGDLVLPHYSLDRPHKVLLDAERVRACFDLWQDEASRAEYVAQVRWRLWLDFDNLPPPVRQEIYFPSDLMAISDGEVFVDCGAYDGDTLRDFIRHSGGRFKTAYAFEADRRNFLKLQTYVEGLDPALRCRIRTRELALSDRAGVLHFDATGTASSSVASRGIAVDCGALDESLDEPPTWIKMDIEGSEPAALRGAARAIARHAPVLSICVYHSQDHVWAIPTQIAKLRGDYALILRPFVPESWDLVCYAIPKGRLLR